MMRNRLYTRDEVIQVVEAVLTALDNQGAPVWGQEHLDNSISQQSSPGTKMTLSVREAAELIGISKPKMYELIHSHEIPSIHVGKKITISRKALMDWLSEGETNGKKRANGEGSIRKRADGSWEARYSADGKRHSVYGRTQAEVRKKLTEVSVTIDHGDYREDSGLTLGQWLTIWHRDYLGNVKLGTADTYEMQMRVHIIPSLGQIRLSALRTPMIQCLYNKKREEGLSPKSIKNIHGCLHKALDVAVKIGYLSKNPSSNCILPRIEQAEIHPLDTPELSRLLAYLKGHEHEALIVTAIFTGLRSGELLGLTWDAVDFENGLIRVTKQLAQPRKKGEVFRFATPKNSKPRTIAPAPTVFQVLKKHKQDQEEQRREMGPAWNDGGFPDLVFTHLDGSHLSQPTVWKILQKVLAAAGVEAHRFHDLRHTYVVSSIRAGDDVKTIQQNAGHYSSAFTLDRYAHVTATMQRESATRMEKFIAGL